jgi:transposase-like protein
MANRHSPAARARAVQLMPEHRGSHATQGASIAAIAPGKRRLPQAPGIWVCQAETDSRMRDAVTSDERDRIKTLQRERREFYQTNEILGKAPFAQAGFGRPFKA